MRAVGRRYPAGLILILLFSIAGCGGGGTASRTVLHLENYAAVATRADEFRNIWGQSPTATELNKAIVAAGQASELGFKVPAATQVRTAAESFFEQYRTSTADVVTLVGHNDEGTFRFADGSPLSLSELSSAGGPPVAMISCNSMTYANGQAVGVPSAITFTVAYATQAKFAAKLASRESVPTASELQSMLIESLDEAATESGARVKYVVFAVGTGGGGIAIWQELG